MHKICTVFFLFLSCGITNELPKETFQSIIFYSSGRNYQLIIIADSQQLSIHSLNNSKNRAMPNNLWQKLEQTTTNLNDSLIINTPAPSQKFIFDGAYHSQLKFVKHTGDTLITQTFDHNNPPPIFQKLITILLEEKNE